MRTVWKYQFAVDDTVVLTMPRGARILPHVEPLSPLALEVWAQVETTAPPEQVQLYVVGTGNPMPPEPHLYYLATAVARPFVWHVYLGPSKAFNDAQLAALKAPPMRPEAEMRRRLGFPASDQDPTTATEQP